MSPLPLRYEEGNFCLKTVGLIFLIFFHYIGSKQGIVFNIKTMRVVYTFLTLLLLSQAPAALAGCAIEPNGSGHVDIPDGQTSIDSYSFSTCTGTITSVTIPDTVTSIDASAFIGCSSLTSITIPDSVTSIGINAFYGCTALTSVTIGSGVTSIDDSAFNGCSSLTSITIPDSVTSTGHSVFAYSGLTSVTIESGVTSLGANIFRGCTALTSITIPDTVTSFGVTPFYDCSALTQVCGVDVTQTPFSDHSELQVQANQAQCTEPLCPAGTSGVKWCMPPPCTSPDTTGYVVTETDLKLASFDVTATCATGTVGTASVSACSAGGEVYVLSGCRPVYDCANPATTGTFALADDCQLSGQVTLSGDLDILGVVKGDGSYPVVKAASSSRHFTVSGAHKLTLKYLKMIDGDVGSTGGSIFLTGGNVNISHCVFFNNRAAQSGGVIHSQGVDNTLDFDSVVFNANHATTHGGALWIHTGVLVEHSCTYTMNTAGGGGAIFLGFTGSTMSSFDSTFEGNIAVTAGGAIWVHGYSIFPLVSLTLTRATLKENKQTGAGTDATHGGGGLSLSSKVTANIRESTFTENEATADSGSGKQGHQVFTSIDSYTPSVTIVNTQFTDIAGGHAFYGYDSASSSGSAATYVSPADCSANPCTEAPFTHTCAVLGNEGVTCDYDATYLSTYNCGYKTTRTLYPLPPPVIPCSCAVTEFDTSTACQQYKTSCPDGEFLGTDGTATSDHSCTPCEADEKSTGGAPCKKLLDCLTATEQGHRNIDIGFASGDYTVSLS